MARTFLPQLVRILRRLCQYITKYGPTLRDNLTPTGQALLDEVMEVCSALTAEIDDPVGP